MKILTSISFSVALFVLCLQASAQEAKIQLSHQQVSKPKLFKELPNRINVNLKDIDGVFVYETGKEVSIKLAPDFIVSGNVVSKAEDIEANVKTIVIRAANRGGATLSLSRYINEDNTIGYRGMLMSLKHEDAYEVSFENGAYFLQKRDLHDLIEE